MPKSRPLRFQPATSGTARDINRRIVLNCLHRHQPVSRSELARRSGLQCSTVSLIVEDLIAGNWVAEGAVTDQPRGRKPTALHLDTVRKRIVGIDIRPHRTEIGVADLNGRFVALDAMETSGDPATFLKALGRRVAKSLDRSLFDYAGIGAVLPGRVDNRRRPPRLCPEPRLARRGHQDPRSSARPACPSPSSARPTPAPLAEVWFGAPIASRPRDLVAIAVSEGCGAGIIMNNQLMRGPTGLAGEFGHVSIGAGRPGLRLRQARLLGGVRLELRGSALL